MKMAVVEVLPIVIVTLIGAVEPFIAGIQPRLPLPGDRAPPGSPWPEPRDRNTSETILTLDPTKFRITNNMNECDVVEHNIRFYRKLIFADQYGKTNDQVNNVLTSLELNITSAECEKYPSIDMNEHYTLTVSDELATLVAETVWGAIRGLETFSQLVWQAEDGSHLINKTNIDDQPRFAYRGLLLDTARHFLPTSVIKKNLDAMRYNKFNVFHWHLTDDQSFPFESSTFPELSKLVTLPGAYLPELVYNVSDVRDVIEHARLAGIRVIPEVDSPGHTRAIGNAFPQLLTPCYGQSGKPYTAKFPEHSAMEVFLVSNDTVFRFMEKLLSDIRHVFVDRTVHLGLDEVNHACWMSNPDIRQFMDNRKWTSPTCLEEYYAERLTNITKDVGFEQMMAYQDPITNGAKLPEDTVIQVWRDRNEFDVNAVPWREYAENITGSGYHVVISACWYINYIKFPVVWKDYYNCDPQDFPGSDAQKALVVGGEGAMWTELADDTNLLSTIWPSASAIAERLWSKAGNYSIDDVRFRLDRMRCLLLRRGIPAQPILPGYCSAYERSSKAPSLAANRSDATTRHEL